MPAFASLAKLGVLRRRDTSSHIRRSFKSLWARVGGTYKDSSNHHRLDDSYMELQKPARTHVARNDSKNAILNDPQLRPWVNPSGIMRSVDMEVFYEQERRPARM